MQAVFTRPSQAGPRPASARLVTCRAGPSRRVSARGSGCPAAALGQWRRRLGGGSGLTS